MLHTTTFLAAMVVAALAAMHGLAVGGSLVLEQDHRTASHTAVMAPGTADAVTVSHASSGGESDAPGHHEVAGAEHCVAVLGTPSTPRVTVASVPVVAAVTGIDAQPSPNARSPAEPRAPDLSRLCLLRI